MGAAAMVGWVRYGDRWSPAGVVGCGGEGRRWSTIWVARSWLDLLLAAWLIAEWICCSSVSAVVVRWWRLASASERRLRWVGGGVFRLANDGELRRSGEVGLGSLGLGWVRWIWA